MIVLDTNVVSEPLKPRPDGAVLRWLVPIWMVPETRVLVAVPMQLSPV